MNMGPKLMLKQRPISRVAAGTVLSVIHTVIARPPFRGRGLLERAAVRLFRGTNAVRVRPGYWINLDLSNQYERQIFAGDYEEPLLRFIRSAVRPGDVFVDGGSNIGVHALNAAVAVGKEGRVYAFEPDPETFARAVANLALNEPLSRRIILKQLALGDECGSVAFAPGGAEHLQSRVAPSAFRVPCSTLDAELPADVLRGERIVVCKLDVEGYEERVLAGGQSLLHRPNTIFICELNDPYLRANGSSANHLIARMRSVGYTASTDAGAPLIRHDPAWVPWLNGVFALGERAKERVAAAFEHPVEQ